MATPAQPFQFENVGLCNFFEVVNAHSDRRSRLGGCHLDIALDCIIVSELLVVTAMQGAGRVIVFDANVASQAKLHCTNLAKTFEQLLNSMYLWERSGSDSILVERSNAAMEVRES